MFEIMLLLRLPVTVPTGTAKTKSKFQGIQRGGGVGCYKDSL